MTDKLKPGDIVVNHHNKTNQYSSNHPMVQITKDKAALMTTKELVDSENKTLELQEHEIKDMIIRGKKIFVTDNVVPNSKGRNIGTVVNASVLCKILKFLNL